MALLQGAGVVDDIPAGMKRLELGELLGRLDVLAGELAGIAEARSRDLSQSHRRVRRITKEGQIRVRPQLPMDILGLYVLQPGVRRNGV